MIFSEAGVHPSVSALVYVVARAPDAGEEYAAIAERYPKPPATSGIIYDGDEGRLTKEALLRDFAPDLPPERAVALYAAQWSFYKARPWDGQSGAAWRSKPPSTLFQPGIVSMIPTCSAPRPTA